MTGQAVVIVLGGGPSGAVSGRSKSATGQYRWFVHGREPGRDSEVRIGDGEEKPLILFKDRNLSQVRSFFVSMKMDCKSLFFLENLKLLEIINFIIPIISLFWDFVRVQVIYYLYFIPGGANRLRE